MAHARDQGMRKKVDVSDGHAAKLEKGITGDGQVVKCEKEKGRQE